ncbi:MAG TPA: type VI secretion system-associated FHA domain protein TagH [Burkholderiales bacterium]|nr:type VI secretion system-associated FHA domain protein TagH [Burkholderiales bacterium]
MISVKILNRSGARPALYASRDFARAPVTIGRDSTCSVALDDPNKHISRFHVEIEEVDGVYWMSVVSKVNPVLVGGRRFGPGTRLTLKSGDSFEIGEYEIQVGLPEAVAAQPPARPADPTAPPMSDSPLLRVLATGSQPAPVAKPAPAPAPVPAASLADAALQEATFVPSAAVKALARAQPGASLAPDAALRAFLEGAGLPFKEVSAAQAERMLRDCGGILRAAVEGIMMLLITRGEARKEMQAEDRTMVGAHANNPLKLMSDPHEAMAFLFDPSERTDGFLDPVQAVGDACEDLRAHEQALMAGMRAAVIGVLRRLNPHALEVAFEKSTTAGLPLPGRKGRLWDLYMAHHEKLAHDAQEDFNKAFGREFMGAYQEQLRRMKGGR